MRRSLTLICLLFFAAALAVAQPSASNVASTSAAKYDAEIALAKLAVEAHGGDKLRNMKAIVLRGSVDVTASSFNQAIPATFVVTFAREKYRFEIMNPFQPIKVVFDGVTTSNTIRGGLTLPPVSRIGFPVLQMIGEQGFIVTPLPDGKKKRGFRLTSPEGIFTNFYLDEKTNQIKGYDAQYEINGRVWTTSVEVDAVRVVDGVTVPEKYAQRFDSEQMTIYALFKTKEIIVNPELASDVFSIK